MPAVYPGNHDGMFSESKAPEAVLMEVDDVQDVRTSRGDQFEPWNFEGAEKP